MIIPIAATMVNWNAYIAFVTKQGYESPTRILDKEGIDINDMSALLGTLGNKSALENIRQAYVNKTTDYIQLIFADDSANMGIAINSSLKVRNYGGFNLTKEEALQYSNISYIAEELKNSNRIVIDCDSKETVKIFEQYLNNTRG